MWRHSSEVLLAVLVVTFSIVSQIAASDMSDNVLATKSDGVQNSTNNSSFHEEESDEDRKEFKKLLEDIYILSTRALKNAENESESLFNSSVSDRNSKQFWFGTIDDDDGRKVTDIVQLAKAVYKKNVSALLLAYKLKFLMLLPLFIAAKLVAVKTSALAGFFLAMLIATLALRGGTSSHH